MEKIFLYLCLAAVFGGCAVTNPQVRITTDQNASLLYGYFDLSEAPYKLKSVRLTQGERAGIAYRQSDMTTYDDGLFFMENIPPMDYHIPWFMAGGKLHSFGGHKEDVFKVPPHSLVFLGSYKYRDPHKGGIITTKKFEMNPSKHPSEEEVLEMLLSRVQDPRWKKRIQARLQAVSR
jgi:hypothetical protein